MCARTNALGKRDLFGGGGSGGQPDNLSVNGHLRRYITDLREQEDEQVVAEAISIFEVQPDPMQPRRALPSSVRELWTGGHDAPAMKRLFETWLHQAGEAAGYDLEPDLSALITGQARLQELGLEDDESQDDQSNMPTIARRLLRLAGLAGDIRANDLTNAISVWRFNQQYVIETGERRWLAHHLLHLYFPDETKFGKVLARIADHKSVWKQAGENSVREELNAIARSRQLALLLMDIHGMDKFQPYEAFASEQDFYAQVSDGNTWRVPRGVSEKLVNAMGLQNPNQLRHYRALLRIPAEVWRLADDEDWAERHIRQFMSGDTVTMVTVSDDAAPSPIAEDETDSAKTAEKSGGNSDTKTEKDLFSKFATRQLKEAKQLDRPVLLTRVSQLRELLIQLEQVLEKKK